MRKTLKIILFVLLSTISTAIVDITLIFQFILVTYTVTVIIYFLCGLLIKKKNLGFIFLFLIPLIFLNLFALVVNPETFPTFAPITLILGILAFLSGQNIKKNEAKGKYSAKFYTLLSITLLSFLFSLYFAPHYMYNKNREKITGAFPVYNRLSFSNLDGASFDLNTIKGKTVLIENWFLDCYQCILKMPSLQSLSDRVSSDSTIKIITVINVQIDSLDKVLGFLKKILK